MRSGLLIFLFIYFFSIQFAETQHYVKTDSLDSVLRALKEPNRKVDAIIKFLEDPENQYLENALEFAKRANQIAQEADYTTGRLKTMLIMGNYYFRSSEYELAMEYAQKSRELAEDLNYDKELANSLSLIGTIYNELGDYDKSSGYFFKSLKLNEKIGYKEGISHSLGNIGMDFFSLRDHKKALNYFNDALTIALEIQNQQAIKRQYNNIAVVYQDLQKYDTANTFLRKALEININLGDKLGQGTNIMNIGYGQLNSADFDNALISFQQALDLFTELDNRLHMAECYLNFGFCYHDAKKTDKGIEYFKLGLKEGQSQGYDRIIYSAAEALSNIYTERRDTANAYSYVMIEKSAGDSLFANQKQKLLSKLELQYIYEKKEFERQLAQQTKNTIMLIIIFSLISGLVILGLIFSRHKLKSRFILLEKDKIESELDIKNRELSVNLISLIKKNEMLSEISDKLVHLELNEKANDTKTAISKISRELRNSTNDKMLNEFSMRFQEVHAGFYEKLLKSYPDLTQNELKLCAFLRLNMSTKDIAELTGQQLPSIDRARYRLRKKLALPSSETNLVTFLSQI